MRHPRWAALLIFIALLAGITASAAPPTPVTPITPIRPVVQPRFWQSVIPFWGVGGSTNTATQSAQLTLGEDFSLEGQFTAVQLILENVATTSVTLPGIDIAVSATASPVTTPSTGTWVPVTLGGATSLPIPAAASANQPALILSDIIPIQSVSRTDGGAFPLLFTRTIAPASGTSWTTPILASQASGGYLNLPQYNIDSGGRTISIYYAGGNYATVAQTALTDTNAVLNSTYPFVIGVRYLSPNRIVTMLGCGDSLTAGLTTISGFDGFGLQAAVGLSKSLGIGVSYAAHGYPGQTTPDIAQNCINAINLLLPGVVTMVADSPNDYTGESTAAAENATELAMQARVTNLADFVLFKNAIPVVLTPIPFSTYDASTNFGAQRVADAQFSRLMSARGAVVIDAQSIISGFVPTSANLPVLPTTCKGPDNAHLTAACQGQIGQAVASALAGLL